MSAGVERQEEARLLATAAKRKLQRVHGALEALEALQESRADFSLAIVSADAEVRDAHAKLTELLQMTDGGETLRRARDEWFEASAQTDYVRIHERLAQYRPKIEEEEAEALRCWEEMQPWREQIRLAKMNVAVLQGRLYALLELGFRLPENLHTVLEQQRQMWSEEREQTEKLLAQQTALVHERRERNQLFHREQGWRKAVERFGGLLGLGPEALLAVRLQVLEADEIETRTVCKARVRALDRSLQMYEASSRDLLGVAGAIALLSLYRERTPSELALHSEEYEASMELQMIKASLAELKPRNDEALRLRLGWQSAVGAHKVAELLQAPELPAAVEQVNEAKRAVEGAESVRTEKISLESFEGKVMGKLDAIRTLRKVVAGETDQVAVAAEVERSLSSAKLAQLRLSMKNSDLRLMAMRHEKAQANLHASGGALVCIKRIQRRIALEPAASHNLTLRSVKSAPEVGEAFGTLSAEMRGFIRGFIAPILRAGLRYVMMRQPPDPLAFLADFFWQHSSARQNQLPLGEVADVTEDDLQTRRGQLARLQEELQLTVASLASTVDATAQADGATRMLHLLLHSMPQREFLFNDADNLEQSFSEMLPNDGTRLMVAMASTVHHRDPSVSFQNAQLLDTLATVLQYYPKVMLQVHMTVTSVRSLLASCLRAEMPAYQSMGDEDLLAWRQSSEVVLELISRGVPPQRLCATAPGRTRGLEALGSFTMHPLPEALAIIGQHREGLQTMGREVTIGSRSMKSYTESIAAAGSEPYDAAEYEGHHPFILSRLDNTLWEAQKEFDAIRADASRRMLISKPLRLVVSVNQVSMSSAALPRNLSHGSEDAEVYIAFGTDRYRSQMVTLEVQDKTISELDIELWEESGERILGHAFMSLMPLLNHEEVEVEVALPLTSSVGLVVGSARVQVRCE